MAKTAASNKFLTLALLGVSHSAALFFGWLIKSAPLLSRSTKLNAAEDRVALATSLPEIVRGQRPSSLQQMENPGKVPALHEVLPVMPSAASQGARVAVPVSLITSLSGRVLAPDISMTKTAAAHFGFSEEQREWASKCLSEAFQELIKSDHENGTVKSEANGGQVIEILPNPQARNLVHRFYGQLTEQIPPEDAKALVSIAAGSPYFGLFGAFRRHVFITEETDPHAKVHHPYRVEFDYFATDSGRPFNSQGVSLNAIDYKNHFEKIVKRSGAQ